MRKLLMVSASVLALWPGLAAAQVTLTGDVRNAAGQEIQLSPDSIFVQSCNNGAGGIVGQGNCTLPTGGGTGGNTTIGNVTVAAPLGSQTSANGISVTVASDQAAIAVKGSLTSGGNVTISGPTGQTTKSASIPVTIASDQGALGSVTVTSGNITVGGSVAVTGSLTSGGNVTIVGPLGNGLAATGITIEPSTTAATDGGFATHTDATSAIPAGNNTIGALVANQTVVVNGGNLTSGGAVTITSGNSTVAMPSVTTGGATLFHLTSSAGNNTTEVSAGAHTLYALTITGTNTAIGDVRLYDVGTAPNCASATGVVSNWQVITTTGLEGGLVVPIPAQGILFATGLAYCITGANADNDNTNAPTGININGAYK